MGGFSIFEAFRRNELDVLVATWMEIYNKVLLGKNRTQNELYDMIHLYKF